MLYESPAFFRRCRRALQAGAFGSVLFALGWLAASQRQREIHNPQKMSVRLAPIPALRQHRELVEDLIVPPCAHGTMYYGRQCVCSRITTGPLCELFVSGVSELPTAKLCIYGLNPRGLAWAWPHPYVPDIVCDSVEEHGAFAAAFAFKLAPAALPYDYEASTNTSRENDGIDPFILHILRTFGPWDAEDARLLTYFSSADAAIPWRGALAPPSASPLTTIAAGHIGLVVMISGNVDINHFSAWWSCWGHRSHSLLRYVIHLDLSAPLSSRLAILSAIAGDERVVVVPRHHSIAGAWGAATLVYIHLLGMDFALGAFPSVEYIINLSLHDVMLMNPADLQQQLRASNADIVMGIWADPADDVRSKRGGPRAPSRLSHYINGVSHMVFDLPSAPWSIQGTLWNESWRGLGGPGVSVEWGSIQWSAWSRAGTRALLSDKVLVQLLFSLKHTSVLDERFLGCAAVHLERHRGLRWQRSFRRFNGYTFDLGNADGVFRQSVNDRPFMARKVFWNATAGSNDDRIWRRVWGEVQPACVAAASEPATV